MKALLAFVCLSLYGVLCGCRHAVSRPGYLMGGISGDHPKEGDIKFRDPKGNWYVLQGLPLNLSPYTDKSVTAAIIDSGVMADHPQLKGLIAEQKDFTGEGTEDRIGHGTIVTLIFLQTYVAYRPYVPKRIPGETLPPLPRIIEAKVANADGTIDKNDLIRAIDWAVQRGAKTVNLSLGFQEGADDYSGICDMVSKNPQVIFVSAAGNLGPNVRVYPAACKAENMFSTGATNADGKIAAYSGTAEFYAPGTAVLQPMGSAP